MRSIVWVGNTGEICRKYCFLRLEMERDTTSFFENFFWYDFMTAFDTKTKSNGKK